MKANNNDEAGKELLRNFLSNLDAFARQALADVIASGEMKSHVAPNGERVVDFDLRGLEAMERREEELRRAAN